MNPEALQCWLVEHAAWIAVFSDITVADHRSVAELVALLDQRGFGRKNWDPGHRFIPFGKDPRGGIYASWIAPDLREFPIVYLGAKRGAGILARSARAFAQALAHGPIADEYSTDEMVSSELSVELNWKLTEPDTTTSAVAALRRYRIVVEETFGPVPSLAELTNVDASAKARFTDWAGRMQQAYAKLVRDFLDDAAARKLAAQRTKAARLAATSNPVPASAKDGDRFDGTCACCSGVMQLRAVRFEAMAFGLCIDCYFSDVW